MASINPYMLHHEITINFTEKRIDTTNDAPGVPEIIALIFLLNKVHQNGLN
ncbi:MAG: hypothetical protein NVV82_10840 [Sporocytophaga sp.]|nr:hypothetical protein [Sporocytophaga sp.]